MHAYSSKEVAELDRYTIEELGVDLKQLMEIAGMRSAETALKLFGNKKRIAILVGPGGNGGDALVCAKWLKLWGCNPNVFLSHDETRLKPVTLDQLNVWKAFSGRVYDRPFDQFEGIIDGLLGYSLEGNPRGNSAELIRWANSSGLPILALDVPSGLDATTGEACVPCVKATLTIAYGVMKTGLIKDGASDYSGKVEIVDIGFPRELPETLII